MRCFSLTFIFLFITVMSSAQDFSWDDLISRVADAQTSGDRDALIALAERRKSNPAEPSEWNAYWRAYLNYRAAYLSGEEEPDKEKLEACADTGELAIDRGEESGESHALLGLCFGQLAGTGMMAGMRYSSKSQAMLDEALMIAPDSPRVLLAAGINDLYKPAQYGGDIDRAVRRLQEARRTLTQGPDADNAAWHPAWGKMDAHAHLAIALARLDRPDEALEVLHEADKAGLESPWLNSIRKRLEALGSS